MTDMNFKRDNKGKVKVESCCVVSIDEANAIVEEMGNYGRAFFGENDRLGTYLSLSDYFNEGRRWIYLIRVRE
jgi:hypothetical protein